MHPEPSEDSLERRIKELEEELATANHCWKECSDRLDWLEDRIAQENAGKSFVIELCDDYRDKFFEIKEDTPYFSANGRSRAAEQVIDDHKETLQKLADNPYPYKHLKEECVAYQEGGMGCPDCYDFICDVCGKKHNSMERHTLKTEQLSGVVMCEDCSGGNTTDRVEEDILDDEDESWKVEEHPWNREHQVATSNDERLSQDKEAETERKDMHPALKLAESSCRLAARVSFALTMYTLQKIEETFRVEKDEKKYYDSINDDDESVV